MRVAMLISFVALSLWIAPLRAENPYVKVTVGDRVGYVVPMEVAEKPDSEVRKFWLPSIWLPVEVTKITGFWTPTEKDIATSDEEIAKYLKAARTDPELTIDFSTLSPQDKKRVVLSAQHEIGMVLDNFKNYQAQYVGILVKGQKRLLCNYFDREHLPPDFQKNLDPTSRMINVNDGGHMYWWLEYNDVSKTCTHLSINGPWEWDEIVIPRGNQVILHGDWTPAKEQTDKALLAVATYIQRLSFEKGTTPFETYQVAGAKVIVGQMSRSCVQYIGYIQRGKKVVYCNFFYCPDARSVTPNWQQSEVSTKDGGPAFWQIYCDPETGKCSELHINGEA